MAVHGSYNTDLYLPLCVCLIAPAPGLEWCLLQRRGNTCPYHPSSWIRDSQLVSCSWLYSQSRDTVHLQRHL